MNTISIVKSRHFTDLVTSIATGFCLSILLVACQKPEEKVENARDKVTDAKQDLKEAKREARTEWQEDWLKFKSGYDKDIADNERRNIELRKEVNEVHKRYRARYNVRIDEFERRNNELRDRVNNYKDEGDGNWVEFKRDMKRDMDELKSSLKTINVKNG
jgi:vacuolar-type H+-ATPase subunit H